MSPSTEIAPDIRAKLISIYEEIIWLAQRPNVRPAAARAWYTHIAHLGVRRDIREFTGKVSQKAAVEDASVLRLEHFKRIQTTLTQLVAKHLASGNHDCAEFVNTVMDFERVHIVTLSENYAAMKAKGDYELAGIVLLDWHDLPVERRRVLWKKVLNGKVSNARDFVTTT